MGRWLSAARGITRGAQGSGQDDSVEDEREPAAARVPDRWRQAILAVLVLGFVGVGLWQAARDAPTVDEGVDVSSGVSALVRHDLRMVPEHPVLPRAVAALPALIAQPIVPDSAAWRSGDWFGFTDDFVSANEDAGRLRSVLFWARTATIAEGLACAGLIYLLARRFFGVDGALLAAGAWLTTPYTVGLSHLAGIDIPFTVCVLGACVLLARWWDAPSAGRAAALGAGLGAGLASRHTALVVLAVAGMVVLWTRRHVPRDAARDLATMGLVSVVTVWAVYRGLDPSGPSGVVADRFDGLVATARQGSAGNRLVSALPLPTEWRAGFAYLDLTSSPRRVWLAGQSWVGGRWWYFPVSAVLKLPAVVLVAVLVGWVAALRNRHIARRRLVVVVAVPALALWLFLLAQPLNLGLRLALPVVALAFVGIGGLAGSTGKRWWAPVLVAVGLLQVAATVVAAPHSLAWTPPPWRPAYQWVADANLDAGQGLYEVRSWAKGRHAWVALDRTRGLEVGAGTRPLLEAVPGDVRGWVAVGASALLQNRRHELAWLRKYCPVGSLAGGSVLVYRFEQPPDPSPGPTRPVAPCHGADESRITS